MLRILRRLSSISPAEWVVLPHLVLVSFVAALGIRFLTLHQVVRMLQRWSRAHSWKRLTWLQGRHETSRLVALSALASRVAHGMGPCLARSLILYWLLQVRGEPVEILIGVHKQASEFKSHAWIESRGQAIGDSDGTVSYSTLIRMGSDEPVPVSGA